MRLDTPADNRDANGRFGAGNRIGQGRTKGRGYELQRAAQEAVTVEHIQAVMRKALRMALEGNLAAMRFVMERTCGKAPELPAEIPALDFSLPHLTTAAQCNAAIDLLAAAITAGAVDLASGRVLLDLIQTRLKAIEVGDLEKRIMELEGIADTVEHRGPRRLRRS